MILKAVDYDNLFNWTAIGIRQPKDKSVLKYDYRLIGLHKQVITRKEMLKLLDMRWKDSFSYLGIVGDLSGVAAIDPKTGQETTIDLNNMDITNPPYIPTIELE